MSSSSSVPLRTSSHTRKRFEYLKDFHTSFLSQATTHLSLVIKCFNQNYLSSVNSF